LGILCSFNLDLIAHDLRVALEQCGFTAELYFSGYGQWESDALNPASALYRFAPDVVVLFAELSDLVPLLSPDFLMLSSEEEAQKTGEIGWQRVKGVVTQLLHTLPPQTMILCHNVAIPPLTPLGLLEGNGGYSLARAGEVINAQLRQQCSVGPRVLLFDYAGLVTKYGWETWHDRRLWHLGRMRLARSALPLLARHYARYLAALYTPRRKCLVLDLDNTLWGGVIGEDGLSGIQVGHEGLGLAYHEFQMAVLALSRRGVILAVCSKNNSDDALAVLRDHPDMVLRPDHLACLEINWDTKPENLRRIAKRLNVGLDSLVFWDDDPIERELVRQQLPEVLVVDVSEDPSDYVTCLLDLDCFDILSLTDEDRQRDALYRQQAQRELYLDQLQIASLADFYSSLEMIVAIQEASDFALVRVAQLTQRTNQFNLTTHRYSENEVRALAADPYHQIYSLQLKDRFGDLGIVGAAIVRCEGGSRYLDTFLMSCRALGRGVEDAFLAYLLRRAGEAEAPLIGCFRPSKKNAPARAFLAKYGLGPPGDWQDGVWEFQISGSAVNSPEWITIVAEDSNG
jgi:FkbH-like protein